MDKKPVFLLSYLQLLIRRSPQRISMDGIWILDEYYRRWGNFRMQIAAYSWNVLISAKCDLKYQKNLEPFSWASGFVLETPPRA